MDGSLYKKGNAKSTIVNNSNDEKERARTAENLNVAIWNTQWKFDKKKWGKWKETQVTKKEYIQIAWNYKDDVSKAQNELRFEKNAKNGKRSFFWSVFLKHK